MTDKELKKIAAANLRRDTIRNMLKRRARAILSVPYLRHALGCTADQVQGDLNYLHDGGEIAWLTVQHYDPLHSTQPMIIPCVRLGD